MNILFSSMTLTKSYIKTLRRRFFNKIREKMIQELSFGECEAVLKCYFNSDDFKLVNCENLINRNHSRIKLEVVFKGESFTICFFGNSFPKNYCPMIKNYMMEIDCVLPKLYFCKNETLVFEDLSLSGYAKSELFDLKHINLVLEVLAKFHAASVSYQETKGAKFEDLQNGDDESIVCDQAQFKILVDCVPNLKDKKDYLKGMYKQAQQFYKVLCHGNVSDQNVMFQYNNGLPTNCKFVNLDHQLYSSPIYDVLYFVCEVTDLNMRQKYFHASLKKYYKCFEAELSKLGIKIQNILPSGDFKLLIKYLLPEVKLRIALKVLQNFNSNRGRLEEILLEINELCEVEKVSREDCFEITEKKLGHNDYTFVKYNVTAIDEVSGFLGEYFRLKIEVLNSGNPETLNFFLKCMPALQAQNDFMKTTGCFQKEIVFYESLVPKMHQVGIHSFQQCVVPTYLCRNEDLIVFEDMNCLNYKTFPPQKLFDYDLLSMIIKKLAVFHGGCLALEEKLGMRINEAFAGAVAEKLITKDEVNSGVKAIETGIKAVPQIIDMLYQTEDQTEKNLFKQKVEKVTEIFYEAVKPSKEFRNVFCESDLWSSNILVKLVEDQPVDCRFIDFQHARYCPPSHDLLSVLYLTTDRSTRTKYMSILIDEYYEKLKETLEEHGVDIKFIYPKETFVESCRYMKPQVVLQMCLWFQIIMCTSDEIKEMNNDEEAVYYLFYVDRSEHIRNMCMKSPMYKQRLCESVLELKEICDNLVD